MSLETKLKTKFTETYRSYSPTSARQKFRIMSQKSPQRPNKQALAEYEKMLNNALKNTEKVSSTRLIRRPETQYDKEAIYNEEFDLLQTDQAAYYKNIQQKRSKSPVSRIQQEQELRHIEYQFQQQFSEKYKKKSPVLTMTQHDYPIIATQQTIDSFRLDIIKDVNKQAIAVKKINDQTENIKKQKHTKDPYNRLVETKYVKFIADRLQDFDQNIELAEVQNIIIEILKKSKESQRNLDSIASNVFDFLIQFEERNTELLQQYFNEQQYVDELVFVHRSNIKIYVIDENYDSEHFLQEQQKEIDLRRRLIEKYEETLQKLVATTKKHAVYAKVIQINKDYIAKVEQCQKFRQLEQLVDQNKRNLDICFYYAEM